MPKPIPTDWIAAEPRNFPAGAEDVANAMNWLCQDSDGELHIAHMIIRGQKQLRFYRLKQTKSGNAIMSRIYGITRFQRIDVA
jgi:hypothetical protein